ncbi:MAG TPA: hypothetical protein VIS71_08390, partial [Terrimicrobium sp.]
LEDLEKYDPSDAGALRIDFSLILGLVQTHEQLLPLPIIAFEAQAGGNPKGRDQATLDLSAAFSGVLAI